MLYISHGNKYAYKDHIFTIQNLESFYTKILYQSIQQIESMLSHHQRVFLYRFDLHCKSYSHCNTALSKFISKLKYWVMSNYDTLRLAYIWVREHKPPTPTQHYHVVIMVDGSKVDTPYPIVKKIRELWAGEPYFPKSPYYRMKRHHYRSIQDAIYRISYLAKVATKSAKKKATNAYSCSRIKPHPTKTAFDFDNINP